MAMASLMTESFANINISAYRVLFILLTLVRYRSGLNPMELNRHLYENHMIGRGYNSETLTKYVNTLREVGCEIPRSSNRNDYCYELLRSPFPLMLKPEECNVARKLLTILSEQPDESLYEDYRDFLEYLAWAASWEGTTEDGPLAEADPLAELTYRRQQYNEYSRYCREAYTLELTYEGPDGRHTRLVEPHQLLERGSNIILLGMDRSSQEQCTVPLDSVQSVRQLPSKNRRPPAQTIVTFALYGRLASGYRLYADEKVVYRTDKELHIRAKVSDTAGLMSRLLKYGASCQILSPESLRDSMLRHINRLLVRMESDGVAIMTH